MSSTSSIDVLIIGSGGREHALAWKISQSPRLGKLYVAPGNAGTAGLAENVPIPVTDIAALKDFALEKGIGLTVVGPDDVLAAGLVDVFEDAGLVTFGPRQAAARLESSKSFGKDFMQRHGIPTARASIVENVETLEAELPRMSYPLAVKADGLALGKGVIIAQSLEEARAAATEMLGGKFGAAGHRVLLEEYLAGEECSVHALVDGQDYLLFPAAQDHKRIYDNDEGPNTGGMGTYSPIPRWTPALEADVRARLMEPFLRGLAADGLDFRGMLFPGLVLTPDGFKLFEFNCRFGDPETQVLLARLEGDLLELLLATAQGRLGEVKDGAGWRAESAVCVVMASGGYPEAYEKGHPITGLEESGAVVFHAGTRLGADGAVLTNGGRVLGVTALGEGLAAARDAAYAATDRISFKDAYKRGDIAVKGLR
jgi:phosphoribosylamine--glycine ligase